MSKIDQAYEVLQKEFEDRAKKLKLLRGDDGTVNSIVNRKYYHVFKKKTKSRGVYWCVTKISFSYLSWLISNNKLKNAYIFETPEAAEEKRKELQECINNG